MAFEIALAAAAERDIAEAVAYIGQDSPTRARKWFDGLFATLEQLRELPERHVLVPEADELGREIRSLHYHSHRIIYEVRPSQNTVYIARIYHGARKPLEAKDIE